MFLERALRLLLSSPTAQAYTTPRDVAAVIEGWEIHQDAAAQARDRVAATLRDHGWSEASAADAAFAIVRHHDFLTQGPTGQGLYDVVATNPPYLRRNNVPALLRDEYAGVVPDYARADLLHSFLDRCAQLLTPDGQIAVVAADRVLFNANAARLRAVLGRHLAIAHLERLDPSTTFYRPKNRRAGTPPRIHPVGLVLHACARGGIPLSAGAIYPGTLPTLDATAPRLGEIAQVRLAPWLGTPGIFVVDASTADTLPQDHLVPAVDTDDIGSGDTLLTPSRFAIRTVADRQPPPAILEHIMARIHLMAPRGRRNPVWLPPETWASSDPAKPHFDLSQPTLLIPRIAKRLRVVRVPAGILPIQHNLSIVSADPRDLDALAEALQTEEVQAWIQSRAARLENGYLSITTTLLRDLPVKLPALAAA
jgi:hypothetical protein